MKKLLSKKIGREFYVDPVRTEPFEGLPCFSEAEIEIMKTMELSNEELDELFRKKAELGCVITARHPSINLLAEPPEKEDFHPPPNTHVVYAKTKREELARHWHKIIQEEIASRRIRTGNG